MARIFLSYRRNDTAGHTGRIFDHLTERFGAGRVFIDVDGIEAGENFATAIEKRIRDCDTLVAVIGKTWVAVDGSGQQRLDDPDDYVRQEIETAFRLGVDVVPVLVGGAGVPARNDLPESLSGLLLLNALEIDDKAFLSGVDRLIVTLEKTTARASKRKRLEKPALKKKEAAAVPPSERPTTRKKLQRFLLLYSPSHPATWIVHALFYFGLLVLVVAPPVMVSTGETSGAVAIAVVYLAILGVLRAIAAGLEGGATANSFRRWWLVYKAPRAGTTVLHIAFFLLLLVTATVTVSMLPMIASQTSDLAKLMFVDVVLVLIVLTFTIREIAAARDPLRPAGMDSNWFVRLFYIWRPRRAAVWLPRLVWYASAFVLLLLGPGILADSANNLRLSASLENIGEVSHIMLILAVAISGRGWVRSLEISRLRMPGSAPGSRVRRFLPFRIPSKAIGWLPLAMCWISAALVVGIIVRSDLVLGLLGLSDANVYYIAALATLTAVGASQWARVFEGVDTRKEEAVGTVGV
jgi:TIR domain